MNVDFPLIFFYGSMRLMLNQWKILKLLLRATLKGEQTTVPYWSNLKTIYNGTLIVGMIIHRNLHIIAFKRHGQSRYCHGQILSVKEKKTQQVKEGEKREKSHIW